MLNPLQDLRLERGILFIGLVLGGIALGWSLGRVNLVLALVYAPIALFVIAWLDSTVIQRFFPLERSRVEVLAILQAFLDGTTVPADWRYFTLVRLADPRLDAIRQRLLAETPNGPAERAAVIRACLAELRADDSPPQRAGDD
jgi:hypothetical protein